MKVAFPKGRKELAVSQLQVSGRTLYAQPIVVPGEKIEAVCIHG